ncbi:hydro-lyase Fe-S type tartrate/fumarate subfamily beta subunit [Klebsiella variicola CAG:634]|nr:hydro-lyase Fe-S type tartrate/fumarate subfamily beta subunit [Klebsiella variicola CAG:634]
MSNKPFVYQDPFPLKKDDTEYYLLSSDYVSVAEFAGQEVLKVDPQALTLLAQHAFHDASFMLRPAHQQQVADILNDPEASENDKYVALQFLRNSDIAAKGILPTCQDTGTAIIMGKKGQRVWTGGGDEAALAQGVYNTYIQDNLRYSQNAPLDMYKEVNTGTNLPAQIDLYATDGDEYKFLCIAKGGGSANKTYLYQETKALITPAKLKNYLVEKMRTLGTAACPPYHIAFVIGGTSAEATLKTVKLASTKYYDGLPTEGNEHGQAFRDIQLEQELLLEAQNLGLGAQFGGKYFAHDIRVIRLPRHGASCPVGMGVSCSADRNIKAKINRDGIWIEKLESNPGKYIPEHLRQAGEGEAVKVNLNQPMSEILALLSQYPVSTRLSLSGTIIVARDIAHAKLKELIDSGEALPQYVKDHPIYYAGPAKTPDGYASGSLGPTTAGRMDSYVDLLQSHGASKIMAGPAKTPTGYASGSLGPTTAGRMDSYVDLLQSHGASMVMLAKGNRSQQVTDACHKHGGFYLGSIGGPAAVLAQQSIKSLECVAYPELGMEAIWKIEVEDFPAFILVDDKGNDFFQQIQNKQCAGCQQHG